MVPFLSGSKIEYSLVNYPLRNMTGLTIDRLRWILSVLALFGFYDWVKSSTSSDFFSMTLRLWVYFFALGSTCFRVSFTLV